MVQRLALIKTTSFQVLERYGRQSLIIIACLLAAKIIGLFAQARAAVYLGPANYGVSGVVYGLAPFIVLLTNLRMDIVLVREFDDYRTSGKLGEIISSIFSFRLFAFLLVAALTAFGLFLANEPALLLCWLMAILFFASQVLKPYWLLQAARKLHVHYLGMLIQTTVTAGCIFIFFRPGQFLGSDLIAYSIGGGTALLITWYLCQKGMPPIRFGKDDFEEVKAITFNARWIIVTALFSVSYTSIELPLLLTLASAEETGTYRTAVNLSENLYSFLAFTNFLLYPHLIEWQRKGRAHLWNMQKRIAIIYGSGGLLIFLAVAFAAPFIYSWLFSGVYYEAVDQLKILVLAKVFMLLAGIYSWGLMARRADKLLLIVLAPLSLSAILASFLLVPTYGATASAGIALSFAFLFFICTLTLEFSCRNQPDQ